MNVLLTGGPDSNLSAVLIVGKISDWEGKCLYCSYDCKRTWSNALSFVLYIEAILDVNNGKAYEMFSVYVYIFL